MSSVVAELASWTILSATGRVANTGSTGIGCQITIAEGTFGACAPASLLTHALSGEGITDLADTTFRAGRFTKAGDGITDFALGAIAATGWVH